MNENEMNGDNETMKMIIMKRIIMTKWKWIMK